MLDKPLELMKHRRVTDVFRALSKKYNIQHYKQIENLCRVLHYQTLLKIFLPVTVLGRQMMFMMDI
jgi:hypothetical protein